MSDAEERGYDEAFQRVFARLVEATIILRAILAADDADNLSATLDAMDRARAFVEGRR